MRRALTVLSLGILVTAVGLGIFLYETYYMSLLITGLSLVAILVEAISFRQTRATIICLGVIAVTATTGFFIDNQIRALILIGLIIFAFSMMGIGLEIQQKNSTFLTLLVIFTIFAFSIAMTIGSVILILV